MSVFLLPDGAVVLEHTEDQVVYAAHTGVARLMSVNAYLTREGILPRAEETAP